MNDHAAAGLVGVIRQLATAPSLRTTMEIVTEAVRSLLYADGATFVLRDGDLCNYADERAISPLWKGRSFPMSACISGWCMIHGESVAIPDIYEDTRIPHEAYRPTFVRSLAMAPVRRSGQSFAAIGAYWSEIRVIEPHELDLLQTLADASGLAISVAQLTPLAEARLAAETAEARYRAVFDQAAVGVARVSPDGRFLEVNERFCQITGFGGEELLQRTVGDITHVEDLSGGLGQASALIAGKIQTYSTAKRYLRKAGGFVWVNLTASLVRSPLGEPRYFIWIIQDITEQKAAEALEKAQAEHLKLLVNELNHRVKNTLATVQSFAAQTLRGSVDPEDALSRLEGRLLGLSATHNLLTERHWEGATLADVAERSTHPFAMDAPRRVQLSGPQVWVRPEVAVALSLAFHELATNATKYGALSVIKGGVDLGWSWNPEATQLEVVWREYGGPTVAPPVRKGFGSRLLERSLPRELGRPTTLHYQPDGLICRIRMAKTIAQDVKV